MKFKIILKTKILIILTISFVGFLSCSKKIEETKIEIKKQITKEIKVEAYKVIRGNVFEEVNTAARVEGINEATVSGETSGKIVSINVMLGSYIKKGSSILTLNSESSSAMYDQSKIQYELAKDNLEVTKNLNRNGGASNSELKKANSTEKMAKANLERNRIMFEAYSLLSPINGYIVTKMVRVGELLAPGMPVVKISDISKLKIITYVGEKFISKIKKNQKVEINISAVSQKIFYGRIIAISAGLDDRAGGYPIEIVFNNTKNLIIKSGMTAKIKMILNKSNNVLLLPKSCIIKEGSKRFVYKEFNNRAQKTFVSTGRTKGILTEIVSGIEENDVIVGSRLSDIIDGSKINTSIYK